MELGLFTLLASLVTTMDPLSQVSKVGSCIADFSVGFSSPHYGSPVSGLHRGSLHCWLLQSLQWNPYLRSPEKATPQMGPYLGTINLLECLYVCVCVCVCVCECM